MSSRLLTPSPITRGWSPAVALSLGRVSNLPTVWTNTLAAVLLAGASFNAGQMLALLLSMSAAYIGGMFLNDAFDRSIDAVERPERPIPAGIVSARDVFVVGLSLLAVSVLLIAVITDGRWQAITSALVLSATIVLYNAWHKGNPCGPFIMALCRVLVYVTCALVVSTKPQNALYLGALASLGYVIGLTYTAKQERLTELRNAWPLACLAAPLMAGIYLFKANVLTAAFAGLFVIWTAYCLRLIFRRLPGDIPKAVVSLIAGIALVDALLISLTMSHGGLSFGHVLAYCLACIAAFVLTLFLQRYVSGT